MSDPGAGTGKVQAKPGIKCLFACLFTYYLRNKNSKFYFITHKNPQRKKGVDENLDIYSPR